MTAVNEGKDIELDVAELKKALQELMADLDGVLFNGSKADAKNWCEALGLPATSLKENADGTWSVMIDLSPLEQMIDDLDKFDLDALPIWTNLTSMTRVRSCWTVRASRPGSPVSTLRPIV